MKYIRIFFTFLGYITFVALIGAGTFIYVGHLKKVESQSVVSFQDNTGFHTDTIAMTPQKQTLELIDPTPISQPATRDHLVDPPATKRTKKAAAAPKPKPAPVAASKPITYTAPTKAAVKPQKTVKPARSAKPQRRSAPEPIAAANNNTDLGLPTTSIRTFQVTDRAGRERTGHGVVNMDATSDLERAAIRRARAINELSAAADKIRNPQ